MSSILSRGTELRNGAALAHRGSRSPRAQLLHALNQPLTGLQCSMEVALASPRTLEQYAQVLRTGLELTGRMRALVEAIREVTDGEEENDGQPEATDLETMDLKTVLGEVLDDLGPVAEAKSVRITLEGAADFSLLAGMGHGRLSSLVFRTLESAQSLARPGTALRVEMGGGGADPVADQAWVRIGWTGGQGPAEFSRPNLGLLVAQAGWERTGAKWERERNGDVETVIVRLPRIPVSHGNS
jgi:signal transduction histidine kinase